MALNKINQAWKTQVNKGANGRAVPLDGVEAKRIDKKFWKPKKFYDPASCSTGANVEMVPEDKEARTLYGPKSQWKGYVRVQTLYKCVAEEVETSKTWGQPTAPLRTPRIMLGGRFIGRHPMLPVPRR